MCVSEAFPYFTQGPAITLKEIQVYGIADEALHASPAVAADATLTTALQDDGAFSLSVPADAVFQRLAQARTFAVIRYTVA